MDEEVIRRLVEWIKKGKSYPFELELRPTNNCNLRCIFCWDYMKTQTLESEIPSNRLIKIITEAKQLKVRRIHICGGGEPLMRRNVLEKIMKKIKILGMEGRLVTNASLFSQEIVETLVKIGWDEILVSLDSPIPADHDFLRGVEGTFRRVIKTLLLFKKFKKRLKSDRPKIILAPILTNKIYDKLTEMVDLAQYVGAEEVCLQLMINKTRRCKELTLTRRQQEVLQREILKAIEKAKNLGIRENFKNFLDTNLITHSSHKSCIYKEDVKPLKREKIPILRSPCFYPWYYIGIFADSTVHPCADAPSTDNSESIMKKRLRDIWFGDVFNEYRKRLINGNLFPWCETCCGNKLMETRKIRNELLKILK